MQARKLRKILGDTGYTIHETQECICVGSAYISELITVRKDNLQMRYALDTFGVGKRSIRSHDELFAIWGKLESLIANGEIQDIIQGEDVIDNPLPVFTYDEGYQIVESVTDAYGWPNTDIRGRLMYDNTWFATEKEAIAKAIAECEAGIAWRNEIWERKRAEVIALQEETVALHLKKGMLVEMSKGIE